jgi:hypothetical protein
MEFINLTPLTIRIATKGKQKKSIDIKPSGKIVQRGTVGLLPAKLRINDFEFPLYMSVESEAILVSMDGTTEEPFPKMQDDVIYIVPFYIKREIFNRPDVISYLDYKRESDTITCYSFYC